MNERVKGNYGDKQIELYDTDTMKQTMATNDFQGFSLTGNMTNMQTLVHSKNYNGDDHMDTLTSQEQVETISALHG